LREAARQFESLFTRMMLKSMRDASFGDPVFGSDSQKFYQGMFDDQLAVQMAKGHGLGLADMLVEQLTRSGLSPAGRQTPVPAARRAVPRPLRAQKRIAPAAVRAGHDASRFCTPLRGQPQSKPAGAGAWPRAPWLAQAASRRAGAARFPLTRPAAPASISSA